MADLDKFFEKPQVPSHPKARFWRTQMEKGQVKSLRVEVWRESQLLAVNPPHLFVHLYDAKGHEISSPEELEWDNKLNDDLLKLAARAIDEENESLRFGLVLRSRFSMVESRFGDGFFNAVLRLYLESSGFGELPAVSSLLNEIHCYSPSPGEGLDRCVEMIESVLRSCVESLREDLKYSKEYTITIMGGAIATYLDERFHVSERKALGFS